MAPYGEMTKATAVPAICHWKMTDSESRAKLRS